MFVSTSEYKGDIHVIKIKFLMNYNQAIYIEMIHINTLKIYVLLKLLRQRNIACYGSIA